MNWVQRKIYLYNVTFGLFMLDWWERCLFNILVIVLMWFIFYNGSRYVTDFCKRKGKALLVQVMAGVVILTKETAVEQQPYKALSASATKAAVGQTNTVPCPTNVSMLSKEPPTKVKDADTPTVAANPPVANSTSPVTSPSAPNFLKGVQAPSASTPTSISLAANLLAHGTQVGSDDDGLHLLPSTSNVVLQGIHGEEEYGSDHSLEADPLRVEECQHLITAPTDKGKEMHEITKVTPITPASASSPNESSDRALQVVPPLTSHGHEVNSNDMMQKQTLPASSSNGDSDKPQEDSLNAWKTEWHPLLVAAKFW
ncbi:hypothetical protein D5086_000007 [Populus alba]|uniref:Uncharacterized protein n=1 Tax=Populus alba TaxID=43335 RepID=A0ACC4CUK5_POPAL